MISVEIAGIWKNHFRAYVDVVAVDTRSPESGESRNKREP